VGLDEGIRVGARQLAGQMQLLLVEVGAKRGVIAYSERPRLCQRWISASVSRAPDSAVSRRNSGQFRSIITLPATMRRPRCSLAVKKASTDCGCTVQ
jgi:hypothetical protein